jgi:hypothetical protein
MAVDVDETGHQQTLRQLAHFGAGMAALQSGETTDCRDPVAANEHGPISDDAVRRVHCQYEISRQQDIIHAAPAPV